MLLLLLLLLLHLNAAASPECCVAERCGLLLPSPLAGISSLWMGLGWNYYTFVAPRAEPTMSEDITVTQKDD